MRTQSGLPFSLVRMIVRAQRCTDISHDGSTVVSPQLSGSVAEGGGGAGLSQKWISAGRTCTIDDVEEAERRQGPGKGIPKPKTSPSLSNRAFCTIHCRQL